MNILGQLPEKATLDHPAHGLHDITNLEDLSIAGYVRLQANGVEQGERGIVPQPFVMYQRQPATRPIRFEYAEDHTFFTFEQRIHPMSDVEKTSDIGKLIINSASMVIVPDRADKEPFVHLYGTDLKKYLGLVSYAGIFVNAVLFD